MRRRVNWIGVILLGVFSTTLVGRLSAAPLNPKQISAEAKWLAHLDADAMRGSVMAAAGYRQCEAKWKAIGEHLAELRTACQVFDPMTDLNDVTFYGAQYQQDAGVAIVHARFTDSVLRFLYEKVQQLPGYAASNHRAYALHTWRHAQGTRHERSMTAAYVQPDRMIFGTSVAEVAAALDVLDGAKADLAGNASPLAAKAPSGALLLIRVAGLSAIELPIESPIIRRTETLALIIGESNNEAYLTSELVSKDAKTAEEVKAAVDKALAAALAATDDGDVANLINAVQVGSTEKQVTLDVRGPAEVGWFYLEKLVTQLTAAGQKHIDAQKR